MRDRNQTWLIISVGLVVVAVLVAVASLVMGPMMGGGTVGPWMMGGYGPGWGANGWSWVGMLLFWVLLIGGIALVVGWLFRQGYLGGSSATGTGARRAGNDHNSGSGDGGQSAPDILNQRYARGELTKEQYEQMRQDIRAD